VKGEHSSAQAKGQKARGKNQEPGATKSSTTNATDDQLEPVCLRAADTGIGCEEPVERNRLSEIGSEA